MVVYVSEDQVTAPKDSNYFNYSSIYELHSWPT